MNRRAFVGRLTTGLILPVLPASLLVGSSSFIQADRQPVSILNKAAELIRDGLLGTPQHLVISRIYSPEQTMLSALRTIAQQDIDRAGRLIGVDLAIDAQLIFTDSPSATFGSYSARFHRSGMAVTWQGLARVGRPVGRPTGTLRILGSEGVLQITTDERSYRLVNFRGRVVRAENQAGFATNRMTRQDLFSV